MAVRSLWDDRRGSLAPSFPQPPHDLIDGVVGERHRVGTGAENDRAVRTRVDHPIVSPRIQPGVEVHGTHGHARYQLVALRTLTLTLRHLDTRSGASRLLDE